MKKLIIFGNGILARIALFYFNRDSQYEVASFTVNQAYIKSNRFCGLEVLPFERIEMTQPPTEFEMFIAIGPSKMNTVREQKYLEAKLKGYKCASYISSKAICDSPIGENCFIGDMSIVNPFVKLGNNTIAFDHTIICASSTVGNNCYLSPNSVVGTNSLIEDNSIIGLSSVVATDVKIGYMSLIGAMCYISKNTSNNSVYGNKCSDYLGNISHKIDISKKN
jgi:UDP-3-O-[3-hydroxymyristoyl] glucosamine N-acyltransferase